MMKSVKSFKHFRTLFVIMCTFVFAMGCSTILTVRSFPEGADVYMRPMGVQGDKKKVGQTPLSIDLTQFVAAMGFKGPLVVETAKNGFVPKEVLVSDAGATDIELNFELKPEVKVNVSQKIDNAVDRLFEIQRLAQVGRLQDSLNYAQQLKMDYPDMASTFEMEGGVLFLMQRFDDAFDAFAQASLLNPNNPETRKMRDVLAAKLGRRVPSSDMEFKPATQGTLGGAANKAPTALPPAAASAEAPAPAPEAGGQNAK